MSAAPKPPAPYATWAELLLTRSPVSSHEWARVEDGISYAKQFEYARAELAALRSERDALRGAAEKLWDLLDRIDTADDACRGNDTAFRQRAREAFHARHAIMSSDGYKLTLKETP